MKSSTVVLTVILAGVICLILVACVACMAFSLLSSEAGGFDLDASAEIGQLAPNFQLESIDGQPVVLSDFRGQPVLLNFWAIWCGPCLEEMPVLQQRFQQHYPDLVVLAVEEGDSLSELQAYVQAENITFFVLQGTDTLARTYHIQAYPTSFFIDPQGVIQEIRVGSMSGAILDEELAKIGVGH